MDDKDFLVHYGVLGMKWGMHRAAKKGTTYTYKSGRTKSLEKRLSKAKAKNAKNKTDKTTAKIKNTSTALTRSKKVDSKRQAYAKKTSVGKGIAQQMLFGPIGARTYQSMRATGSSRKEALATQILSTAGDLVLPASLGTAYNLRERFYAESGKPKNSSSKKKKK